MSLSTFAFKNLWSHNTKDTSIWHLWTWKPNRVLRFGYMTDKWSNLSHWSCYARLWAASFWCAPAHTATTLVNHITYYLNSPYPLRIRDIVYIFIPLKKILHNIICFWLKIRGYPSSVPIFCFLLLKRSILVKVIVSIVKQNPPSVTNPLLPYIYTPLYLYLCGL